ncbi:MAG: DUF302 domain-containing protein [Epsilonproteobacteria bacterium]|nr:DUF302 domain-containing protein [Campylobacterota bacterium]
MRRWWIIGMMVLPLAAKNGIVDYVSRYDTDETGRRLVKILRDRGIRLFSVIDHADEAKSAGIEMPPMKLFIFGDPKTDARLIGCAPTIGLDLPMKMLVFTDKKGKTHIEYNGPLYLYWRHRVPVRCERKLQKTLGPMLDDLAKEAAGIAP